MNVLSRPTSGHVAAPRPSVERFHGLSVETIRNQNRRSSIDSKYALDARAVSRLSFELWMSKPRIRTSSTCSCWSGSTARRTWRATMSYRSNRRCSPNRHWCARWGRVGGAGRTRIPPSCFPAARADSAQHMARTQAAPRLPTPRLIAGSRLFEVPSTVLTERSRRRRIRNADGYVQLRRAGRAYKGRLGKATKAIRKGHTLSEPTRPAPHRQRRHHCPRRRRRRRRRPPLGPRAPPGGRPRR